MIRMVQSHKYGNQGLIKKSRQTEMYYHVIREIIGKGDIAVQEKASVDNVDNLLT